MNGTERIAWGHSNITTITCNEGISAFSFLIGILLGLGGSVLINTGQNLQALGLQSSAAVRRQPHSSRTWVAGMSIFIVGSLINLAAFSFAPASVLVPLEAVQFLTNLGFAKLLHKQPISARLYKGTALSTVGTIFAVVFGPADAACFVDIDALSIKWTRMPWIIYCVTSVGSSMLIWMVHRRCRRIVQQHRQPPHPFAAQLLPVTFALSSALVGGSQFIVHSKAVGETIELAFRWSQSSSYPFPLAHYYLWIEFLLLCVTGLYWLYRLNESLGLYPPLFIIPVMQSCYIVFGVIGSGIYYEEFFRIHDGYLGVGSWFFFVLGMCLIVVGLYMIRPPLEVLDRASEAPPAPSTPRISPKNVRSWDGDAACDPRSPEHKKAVPALPPESPDVGELCA